MSDLTRFRDHCRRMAGHPLAPGSHAATDRARWLMLAAEVDAYITRDPTVIDPDHDDTTGPLFDLPTPVTVTAGDASIATGTIPTPPRTPHTP